MSKTLALFRKTRFLENQIDEFLDCVSESSLVFKGSIKTYLEHGICNDFNASTQQAGKLETGAMSFVAPLKHNFMSKP